MEPIRGLPLLDGRRRDDRPPRNRRRRPRRRVSGRLGSGPESAQQTLRVLAIAALLPLLFLSLARLAEKKYQRRPPKALQISQFGLYLVGTALVSAGFLRHRANLDPSLPLLFAGEILLGAAALLLAAWIASVLLCTPTEDTLTIP